MTGNTTFPEEVPEVGQLVRITFPPLEEGRHNPVTETTVTGRGVSGSGTTFIALGAQSPQREGTLYLFFIPAGPLPINWAVPRESGPEPVTLEILSD